LYPSLNVIRAITSRSMRWAGDVAHMGESEYRVLVGNLEERDHVEDLGGDVNTALIKPLKKYNRRVWTRLIWLR